VVHVDSDDDAMSAGQGVGRDGAGAGARVPGLPEPELVTMKSTYRTSDRR
jgi:hypothetical protein